MQTNTALQKKHSHVADHIIATWSDETLIRWISDRQINWHFAFDTLTTRHRPWIFRGCLFRLGNHHDAEDATQEIVLLVYNNLHQFQGKAQFRSWLNTIISNYCNTFARGRSRYAMGNQSEQLFEIQELEEATVPDETFAGQQLVSLILSNLSTSARQVLILRFYVEYSLEEIADALCLTLSAAKARLYRAIEQFKHVYQQLESDNSPPSV